MTISKINQYELSVINRYLPDIGLDHEMVNSGNHSIYKCITHNRNTMNQSRMLMSMDSNSISEIEIVTNALLAVPRGDKFSPLIIMLDLINRRDNVSHSLINEIIGGLLTQDLKSSCASGVFRKTIEKSFCALDTTHKKGLFKACNDLSSKFTNNSTLHSIDPISPITDSLRKPYNTNELSPILPNNQALIGLIRRSFPEGIRSLQKRDSDNLTMDEILDLIESDIEPNSNAIDLEIDPEEFIGEGRYADGLSNLAKDIEEACKSDCKLQLTESDTELVSDILMIFSQAIILEQNVERKNSLSEAVVALVVVCYKPILNKVDGIHSIYSEDPHLPKTWLTSELFYNLSSSAKHSRSGMPKADKAISEFFYTVLLNLAASEAYLSKRYKFSPLSICGDTLAAMASDHLLEKNSLKWIQKEDRLKVIENISNEDFKAEVLSVNPKMKRSSLESDLGL